MFYIDLHMHSTVSFDGQNTRAEMADAARRAGLAAICFTDHYDIINEKSELVSSYDWTPARAQQAQALERCGGALEIGYGLELGNAPADFAAAERALAEPLDFVIGSIHNSSRATGGVDYYFVRYDSPELCYRHLDDYFDSLEALVRWGDFDTLGHLPYPLRYMRARDGQPVSLARYEERIRALLTTLAREGKALEVNTDKSRSISPDYRWLLGIFREAGGEFVTAGADAHRTAQVGQGIAEAYELIASCGFRYICRFRGRRPAPVKL